MRNIKLKLDNKEFNLKITANNYTTFLVDDTNKEYEIQIEPTSTGIVLKHNNLEHSITLTNIKNKNYEIFIDGIKHTLTLEDEHLVYLDKFNQTNSNSNNNFENLVIAPITGTLTNINCKINSKVKAGDYLFSIMAMKMENKIHANNDAIVKDIYVKQDDKVVEGQKIIEFKKNE